MGIYLSEHERGATAASGNGGIRLAGADADDLERRVQPTAADAAAAPGRGTHHRARRRQWAQARHGPARLPAHRLWPGHCLCGDERRLRPLFSVDRAEAAQPDAAAARPAGLSKQFVFDDQLHFVRDDYKWDGIADLAKYAAAHWNPPMQNDPVGLWRRSLQVRQLPQGGLLRQRHARGTAQRRAVRQSGQLVSLQRPDQAGGRHRQHALPDGSGCCSTRCSRRSSRAGWTRWIAASRRCGRPAGKATRSAIRCRRKQRNIRGGWTTQTLMGPFYEQDRRRPASPRSASTRA